MDYCQIPKWDGCCCICKHHIKLVGHPWNNHEEHKEMGETIGFACLGLHRDDTWDGKEGIEEAIFHEGEHSICEMFEVKESKYAWLETYKRMKR
jgi:hypothetical protein